MVWKKHTLNVPLRYFRRLIEHLGPTEPVNTVENCRSVEVISVVSITLQSIIIIRHRLPISSVSSANESILNEWSRVRDICLLCMLLLV